MTATPSTDEFYRCPVSAERMDATIRVGRREWAMKVHEASVDGFTVLIEPGDAPKLQFGRPWTLHYEGATLEVHPQWIFCPPNGTVQIGLRRLRDLTPLPHFGWTTRWRSPSMDAKTLLPIACLTLAVAIVAFL